MPNFGQSPVALGYNFDGGIMRDLEDGIVVDVDLGRRHDAVIVDMAVGG